MKKLTLISASIILAGCAASGVQVSQEAATQFKEGVTTEAQIVAKLGAPTSVTIANGNKTITYTGTQYRTNAASFIPIVGLFAGGADYTASVASYQLDSRGVLEKATYSTHGGTSRMGSNPAPTTSKEPSAIK